MQQVDVLEEGGGGWEGEEEPTADTPTGWPKDLGRCTSMYWKSVQSQVPL